MHRARQALWSILTPLLAVGCVAPLPDADDERTGDAEEAAVSDNALSANALSANALSANALSANALSANALSANALSPSALSAIHDPSAVGDLSRQLLKYTVSCAFSSTQSFIFSWTDAQNVVHDESYPGQLGIEPAWETQPLSGNGQRLVSACLAARVNWYGTQVIISVRSGDSQIKNHTTASEIQSYPFIEGAFWGNLFTQTPWLNACYVGMDVPNSRAHRRDCAAGHVNADGSVSQCGMIRIVGDCSFYCQKLDCSGQFYPSCVDQPGVSTNTTGHVITVGLQ